MVEKTFVDQDDKGKEEKKKSLLQEAESLRIEPRKIKSVLEDIPPVIEPKKPINFVPKETEKKKEEKTVLRPVPAKSQTGLSPKTEAKSSPFFKLLFIFSFAFMALALGLLLLPILNISIPPFLSTIINFVSPK